MLQVCLVKMIPVNDVCSMSYLHRVVFFDPFCYALLLMCDLRVCLFTIVATQAFGCLVLSNQWMTQETQSTFAVPGVMLLLLAVLVIILFSCLLVYIAELHTANRCKTEGHSNIFSKMQEGVLILDLPCPQNEQGTYGIKFSNKPANSLLVVHNQTRSTAKEADACKEVLITTADLEII